MAMFRFEGAYAICVCGKRFRITSAERIRQHVCTEWDLRMAYGRVRGV